MNNTYGLNAETVLTAIRENRRIGAFWTRKGFPGIAQSHNDNIRDLRVILLNIRFPENTLPVAIASDFTPVVKVTADNGENGDNGDNGSDDTNNTNESVSEVSEVSESDCNAFADSLADHVADVTGESVTEKVLINA